MVKVDRICEVIATFYNSGYKTVKAIESVDGSSIEFMGKVGRSEKRIAVSNENFELFAKGRSLFVEECDLNGLQTLSVRCSRIPSHDTKEYQLRIVEEKAEF